MVSQIQPHFMYNALTSIAMMCTIDPETARDATVTFAKYLRGNMDSLKQKAPVPFTQELEHLKKYLYIEKLRFGKKLNVEYDIQAEDFVIPMLEVAKRLKDINPKMNIIFVTGFSEYKGDAMDMKASGYIMKPVTKEDVERELNDLRYPSMLPKKDALLKVQCFGNFFLQLRWTTC